MTELWINNRKADVERDTVFSFNSTNTDFSNPTAVKGTYSKTVELPDTENNRRIFNNSSDPSTVYTDFNPKKRTPFILTSDGHSVQGYVRLDSIVKRRGKVTYRVTLMAETGDFFYNLSYDENGQKRTFANMYWHFMDRDGKVMPKTKEDSAIILDWNAKYITESWETLYSYDPNSFPRNQKGVITAAPVYGGYPEDMDSDKILIDLDSLDRDDPKFEQCKEMLSGATREKTWVLTTGSRDYSERETRDYKSWHQRPAIRCSALFDVIADRENNGGYDLVISDAIKTSPYYKDTWLILNQIDFEENARNSDYPVSMDRMVNNAWVRTERVLAEGVDTSEFTRPEADISFQLSLSLNRNVSNLYTSFVYNDTNHTYGGMAIRLRFDTPDGTTYSGVKLISSKVGDSDEGGITWGYHLPDAYHRLAQKIGCAEDEITVEEREFLIQNYEFDGEGSFATFDKPVNFVCPVPSSSALTVTVEMVYVNVNERDINRPISTRVGENRYILLSSEWYLDLYAEGTNGIYNSVPPQLQKTGVTKKTLFSNAMSPYEFLTGFARMLNLRFLAQNGTVTLMTSGEYYTGEVYDLTDEYDTAQDITIDPIPWRTKWVEFKTETPETFANDVYSTKTETPYGQKTIDTGYNFSNETSSAFDGVKFNSAIPYRMSSPWMGDPDKVVVPVSLNSPTYTVTVGDEEETMAGFMVRGLAPDQYDSHPKLCLFDKEFKNVKATGILAFFNHYQPLAGWCTDALRVCEEMNGKQCHVYCFGSSYPSIHSDSVETVAWQFDRIPCFSKYLQDESTGVYTHSLDFNKPELTFLGDADKYPDSVTIYKRRWERYCNDLYADNQFRVTMKAMLRGSFSEAMRRFYFFDGCLWSIASLKDYRLNSDKPQQIEFIKVQDASNYTDNGLWWTNVKDRPFDGSHYTDMRPEEPEEPDTPTPDEPSADYIDQYLTIEAIDGGSVWFYSECALDWEIMTSRDTVNWSAVRYWNETNPIAILEAGEKLYIKGKVVGTCGRFDCRGRYRVSGNIMSMLYGDDFKGKTEITVSQAFKGMFANDLQLVDASNLYINGVGYESCATMFSGCANLVYPPVLGSDTTAEGCYSAMFRDCTSLATAPMLKASVLHTNCYYAMFMGCTSLTTAPEIKAHTIETYSLYRMFMDCTNLNRIKFIYGGSLTQTMAYYWVSNVSPTGTFIKHPDGTISNGDSGIPTGWTVETATE